MTSLKGPSLGGIRDSTLEIRLSDGSSHSVTLDDAAHMLRNDLIMVPEEYREDVRHQLVDYLLDTAKNNIYLAQHDQLTGLYNQGYFKSRLEDEIQRCDRYPADSFSVTMMDLDYFKALNDADGHLVGDAKLTEVAGIIRTETRNSDIIARYGGDEFAFILPNTPTDKAVIVCGKILNRINGITFGSNGKPLALGASFGITHYRKGVTSEDLITEADGAAYMSKRNGRNKISIYSRSGPEGVYSFACLPNDART